MQNMNQKSRPKNLLRNATRILFEGESALQYSSIHFYIKLGKAKIHSFQ
jgi:hypothetical protein